MLSIIIVNYRCENLILDCLQSIYAQPSAENFEVIVADNGSDADGKRLIMDRYPDILWIEMGYNSGFARANNAGIRASKGDTVLLLNPDVLVEENAIEQSYRLLSASDYIGCGVQLLNADRTPQISGNYFMKGGLNHLLPLPVLGKVFKWLGNSLKVKKTNLPEAKGSVEVDWVNGAYLMVKKTAIERAGLLGEDFFLYAEEIEWCARLLRQGRFCIYGHLHVVHLQGEVAGESFGSGKGYVNLSDRRGKQLMLSNFVRIRKQFGAGWFFVHLVFYFIEIPFSFLLVLFSSRKTYTWEQFKGFCKNLTATASMSGIILRNRPYFYKVI